MTDRWGTLEYKCRRCGANMVAARIEFAIPALDELAYTGEREGSEPVLIHVCSDDARGIADLVGVKLDPKPKD